MKPSRREFLNVAALGAAGLAVNPWHLLERPRQSSGPSSTSGLLFDRSELARIRETTKHPRFSPYWNSLVGANLEADMRFLEKELRLNNHVADMIKARVILERSSFVYAVLGDAKHRDVAQLAIDRILEYKRWDYFLEAGEHTIGLQRAPEATIAMSFALEWMDDALSADTKKEMEKQIAEKGAPACYRTLFGMRHPDRVRGWGFDPEDDYPYRFNLSRWPFILNSTNLKTIPICGLGIAGCLLYGKHPQAQRWLDMALQSARAFAPMFGSDGSYDEGVSYWGYTALHLTMFLEAYYRKFGIDERSMINYPGTVRYGLQMSMPTVGKPADCVNFGDASIVGDVSVAAWVARQHRDPIAQYVATEIGEIRSHFALIWFDPTVKAATPGPELYDVRFSNDIVVSRTGWDVASSVVGLRSGGPANHEHSDRNAVIFKAYGERLLHDPFKAAYSYTLPHWVLRQTEAHTAVLIDGKGHQYHDGSEGTNSSWSEAQVVEFKPSRDALIVTSDATEAYRLVNSDVDLVRRTLVFLKPDVLLMIDRVRLKSTKSKVQLRYQVYNEDKKGMMDLQESAFTIRRPQASLKGSIVGSSPVVITSGKHPVSEEIGVYPYVQAESNEALDHRFLTICTAQEAKKGHGTVNTKREETTWVVTVDHNTRKQTVRVDLAADLPVITIS
ncbi:MAG: heparinase II/III family protein [Bacteroidota bacterium]